MLRPSKIDLDKCCVSLYAESNFYQSQIFVVDKFILTDLNTS